MKLTVVAVAVLSLMSVGLSAPTTNCDHLTRRIDIESREQFLGNWVALAESTNMPGSRQLTKVLVENSWVKVSANEEVDGIEAVQYQKTMGACYSLRMNMSLVNNSLSLEFPVVLKQTLMNTSCPDCMVVRTYFPTKSRVWTGLQFLSRRRSVTEAELEEFKQQALCLNLPAPAVLKTETALCPEDSQSQDTQSTDLTETFTTMASNFTTALDNLLTNGNDLFKLINSVIFDRKAD